MHGYWNRRPPAAEPPTDCIPRGCPRSLGEGGLSLPSACATGVAFGMPTVKGKRHDPAAESPFARDIGCGGATPGTSGRVHRTHPGFVGLMEPRMPELSGAAAGGARP